MIDNKKIIGFIAGSFISSVVMASGPDSIYSNGTIITMNQSKEQVEAVAVKDGKITAVGSKAEIMALADAETNKVDLKGKTMLPGFIDAHSHFFYMAEYAYAWTDLNSAPVGKVKSIDDMIDLLKEKAEKTPEGEWVLGWGYDDTAISNMRHPTRADLDKISTKHPIFIQHISGWVSSSNSLALEMAGVTKNTPDPDGGVIHKDNNGEPTGVIASAQSPVQAIVPKYTNKDYVAAMKAGSDLYLSAGVTTAQEGWGDINQWNVLNKALKQGTLGVRVNFWPLAQGKAAEKEGQYPNIPSGTPVDNNNMLVLGARKLTADGSIQGYSGHLSTPYHVHNEDQPADYRGKPSHDYKKLEKMVITMQKQGKQIAIHGNGDAAIDDILDVLEAAQKAAPLEDSRPIIVHSQMAREDQLKRMKSLGAIPSFFVTHTYFWGDRHYNVFMGPERATRMSPVNSALKNGLKYTLHNDTYVTPIDPLMSVWSAVNRLSYKELDLGKKAQGVSVYDALKGVTSYAAWQNFEEDIKGTIEVGKLADFVVLDENPLTINPIEIKDISVSATILNGNLAYGKY